MIKRKIQGGRIYYNEPDRFCVGALQQLMDDGFIPHGKIDNRPIQEVQAKDLEGFISCHFFAGVGIWPYAFRLAGWSDDRPAWSGSCPCQPHTSNLGARAKGFADARDLWPVWLPIIRERCACPIFGEQVDDSIAWIDRMLVDLEQANFAVSAFDLPACAADAPTERLRTLFVADPDRARWEKSWRSIGVAPKFAPIERTSHRSFFGDNRTTGELGRVRRTDPGVRLLAPRRPADFRAIGAAGNAINAQLASAFIKAFMG